MISIYIFFVLPTGTLASYMSGLSRPPPSQFPIAGLRLCLRLGVPARGLIYLFSLVCKFFPMERKNLNDVKISF